MRQITWSVEAQANGKEIFAFWNNHNRSTNYSNKLRLLFNNAAKQIALNPAIGRPSEQVGTRMKLGT